MLVGILLAVFVFYLLYIMLKPDKNVPPGPIGLPFIGHLPITTASECAKMTQKYGKVFRIKFGKLNFVYITDYKLSKEAYQKMEFADRPDLSFFRTLEEEFKNNKTEGIIASNGTHWHHNRRFLLRHLRDLGMGKSKIEHIILREVENLVEDFKIRVGKPSVLPFSINISILNVIWQLVASHRYHLNDQKVIDFMGKITEVQKTGFLLGIPDCFPIINYILPEKVIHYITDYEKFKKAVIGFTDIVQPFIDEHEKNLDPNNPRDLMDDYLLELKVKKSEEYSHFSYTDLIKNTFDLFVAGNDTTANMTRWVLLYMAKFTEIQKKIQSEIDKNVPLNEIPCLEHREKLSYLDATINEIQRHASMISLGVMRSTNADVKLYGYNIPKGSVIFSTAFTAHRDPTFWKNPELFDPSRFLDSKGKCIQSCDGFQPFGLGKRQCLGEQFARMELYLIVGALLKNFTFSAVEGNKIDLSPADIPAASFPKVEQKLMIKKRN